MEHKKFSVFDASLYGLKSVLDNFRLFFLASLAQLGVLLLGCAITIVSLGVSLMTLTAVGRKFLVNGCEGKECSVIMQELVSSIGTIQLIPFLIALLIAGIISSGVMLGYMKIALEFYDTGRSSIAQLFSCFLLAPRYIVALILYSLIIIVGFLLLIVPGIYWSLRFGLFGYLIVDKNAGIIGSLKQSWAMTAGHGWQLFSLSLVMMTFVHIAWPLALLVCFPVSILSYAYVYRKLESPHSAR